MKQLLLTLSLLAVVAFGQRVVPGVNPNQYQQQQQQYQPPPPQYNQQAPPQPHYQQQQQPQYQQHQGQVPVQPQFQQAPPQHQQQQPHQGGHAPHGGQPQQVLNTNNLQHEKQHIAEHMDVPIDTSKMSEQELQFHYFKMHDSDNNNKLDGCELIKSLIHWHDKNQNETDHQGADSSKHVTIYTDEQLSSIVETVMGSMDKNNDGYVSYAEYVQGNYANTNKAKP
ncbi:G-box-binding factor isoform X3 [Uranotaenia lowii]|uniref:G-box-binding factor isoform X3 n=1 Tax=Uranotaenia lowii TaxID=190385 RepID=UPI0024790791|nr:G-box-binding factor isoform X3 [Uranotaenia lowii]